MTYSVKEVFYTLQGEGGNAGRAAVFCRFAGCNLWTGREEDRSTAVCQFCDTDFVGTDGTLGGKYRTPEALAAVIEESWLGGQKNRLVVLTGGEPLLQLDTLLLDALHLYGFEVAVETNGTIEPPEGVDYLCVSPKAGAPLVVTKGTELKVVYPQDNQDLDYLGSLDFEKFFIQPKDDILRKENTKKAIAYCQENPQWRLSIQTHKIIGIR